MARTVLELVKSALYRSNANTIPTALVASSNSADLQLLHLLYAVAEELRALMCWPQLKRTFKVRLVPGQDSYDLPADFYSFLPFTSYDRTSSIPVAGPMTDVTWNLIRYGMGATDVTKSFRLFGYGGRQFKVDPTPGNADAGTAISLDYMSRSVFQPPAWTASEANVAQNAYRQANGLIYKKSDSGTDTAGTTRPTMEFGEGQDGSLRILAVTTRSFVDATLYAAGEYILESGRLYLVTDGGTSANPAPSSTTEDTDITNGTLTLRYFPAPTRAGQTDYEAGDYFTNGSSQIFRVEIGGKSGTDVPQWNATTFTDNTISWVYQDMAYETALSDSDLCVFDDELVIECLRAKLFQARGLGAEDLVYNSERLKRVAKGRWNAGKVLDLAAGFGDSSEPVINYTGGNWTVR